MSESNMPSKLLWVDLEMTGLDPTSDVILEIYAEITDFNFKSLGSYSAIISQPKEKLENMNDWCKDQHAKSGLIDYVLKEGRPEVDVQNELRDFIKKSFQGQPVVLAGNSIHIDRGFISSWWPKVEKLLHYRMLDVSAFKILMQGKYKINFEKKDVHRASDDIKASIIELQYYLSWLSSNKNS